MGQNPISKRGVWLGAAVGTFALMLAVVGGVWLREHRPGFASNPMERSAKVRADIRIQGMDCVMCAAGLQNKLRGLPGVLRADVNFQDQLATVEYDPSITTRARIDATIVGDGFRPAPSGGGPAGGVR